MPDAPGAALDAARDKARPPRDNLVRAMRGGVAVRPQAPNATRADGDPEPSNNANGMPTLYGHFARFNEWTEIDSWYEGNFMERIAPGAFKKTFREQKLRVLFQHGSDPQIGDKVLGRAEVLREDDEGAYYEVPLFDTSYNRDLVPGLEAGEYGASFRFSVMREEFVDDPGASDYNPRGLRERTIKEARVPEAGPVTFPAYEGATAGLRSMTDEDLAERMTRHPERLKELLAYLEERDARPVVEAVAELTEAVQDQTELAEKVAAITSAEAVRAIAEIVSNELGHNDETRSDTPTETSEQEPPAAATAPAEDTTQDTKTAAPERSSTPLYTGNHDPLAAPGEPTPLYIGTKPRKEWEL